MRELSGPEDENVVSHISLAHPCTATSIEERKRIAFRRAKEPHYSHMGGETGVKTLVGNEASPVC